MLRLTGCPVQLGYGLAAYNDKDFELEDLDLTTSSGTYICLWNVGFLLNCSHPYFSDLPNRNNQSTYFVELL